MNAFDYRYGRPSRGDSFAIHTDVMPHPLDSGMVLARIGFQAPELHDDGRPLNVTLVLDSSGSMADGNRIEIARAAADSIRRSLRRDDRISVVQFSSDMIHSLTVENHGLDSGDVSRSIGQLTPRGSTNVQAGLNRGVEKPWRSLGGASDHAPFRQAGIPVLFLISDDLSRINSPADEMQHINPELLERATEIGILMLERLPLASTPAP